MKDIKLLEQVQSRIVKQIHGLQDSTCEEKLVELGLDSLEHWRQKLDLIQTSKLFMAMIELTLSPGSWLLMKTSHIEQGWPNQAFACTDKRWF